MYPRRPRRLMGSNHYRPIQDDDEKMTRRTERFITFTFIVAGIAVLAFCGLLFWAVVTVVNHFAK